MAKAAKKPAAKKAVKKAAKKVVKKAAVKKVAKKVVKKAAVKKVAKKAVKKVAAKKVAKKAVKKVAAKKVAKKAVKKVAKKAVKKPAVKRKPNPAFMRPLTPSAALAAVVGAAPLPRTEVTKKVWDYIKKNKLQDAANKRMINADDKLKGVFGGKTKVSMFEMTKLISNNLK
ncbi:MAG: SWIB/MDM2 domain-containing protein [Proteobacteria bacterium]|nr:SWIB/MDM2 domain-containing protein [Pseudomonadota bacterium]MCL2308202.1 SWIB/MDM2 domain-containing protein [Pseudomonadota bacterium]